MSKNVWDIQQSSITSAGSAEIFNQTGFIVLRNIISKEMVEALALRLIAEFSRLRGVAHKLSASDYKSLQRSEMPANDELATFRLDPANYSHLISSPLLTLVIKEILGEDFVWHYPSMFRKVSTSQPDGLLPFHQDYSYNQHYSKLLTCWVPLNDCGERSPGLELFGKNMSTRFPHVAEGRWEHGISKRDLDSLIVEKHLHHPSLHTGDVILFNETTLHRTYLTDHMNEDRFSMDARAVPLSAISSDVRNKRKFVSSQTPEIKRLI
jgi:ectoine hydroxylase-related dioxygenase (phytanoyl-CoA dioxygenase family)